MAKHTLEFELEPVLDFMRERLPGLKRVEGMFVIGLRRDGRLVAGVAFEGLNQHNVWMHVAAEPGARWMVRGYLRACFRYPFEVLGVRRVSGYVSESNLQARRFDEHLGFKREATLEGAAADGGNVLIYVMWRRDCRFLRRETPQ